MTVQILQGHALDLLSELTDRPSLVVTDPPYAFGGSGTEHALSATVAIVLRETAQRLRRGCWMIVFSASSWRSQAYMVESVRGILEPVRTATWIKPTARTRARTPGWKWASVSVIAFRKGKSTSLIPSNDMDWIECSPVQKGRRAELPIEVARWAVHPFTIPGQLALDPFAGTGALLRAAEEKRMRTVGFEIRP